MKLQNSGEFQELLFPLGSLWKAQRTKTYSTKDLQNLIEFSLRFTLIAATCDYLVNSNRHNDSYNDFLLRAITRKKNALHNTYNALQELWKYDYSSSTLVIEFANLDKKNILKAFEKALPLLHAKAPRNKQSNEILNKCLKKIIPLLKVWDHYSLILFEDYPWWDTEGTTSSIVSFSHTPKKLLHYIPNSVGGIPETFYLLQNKTGKLLSLFPFIIPYHEHSTTEILFCQYFKATKEHYVQYCNHQKKKYLFAENQNFSSLIKELDTICCFLKTACPKNQSVYLQKFDFGKYHSIPLSQLDQYQGILQKISFFGGIVSKVNSAIKYLLIDSFLKKIYEMNFIHLTMNSDDAKQALALCQILVENNQLAIEPEFFEKLMIQKFDKTDEILQKFWDYFSNDINSQTFILAWWIYYDCKQAQQKLQKLNGVYQQQTLNILCKILLDSKKYCELVEFHNTFKRNKNYIVDEFFRMPLLDAFFEVAPDRCFSLCLSYPTNWLLKNLDNVVKILTKISKKKTIKFLLQTAKACKTKPWDFILQAYRVVEAFYPEESEVFIDHIDSLYSIRLQALQALEKKSVEVFENLLESSKNFSVEETLESLCFYARTIQKSDLSPSWYYILQKLLLEITEYTKNILCHSITYYIKEECNKLLESTDLNEMIDLQKHLWKNSHTRHNHILPIFFSYLLTKDTVNVDQLEQLTLLFQEKFASEKITKYNPRSSISHNRVNELLARSATVLWEKDKDEALYYISQFIPQQNFDEKQAWKRLISHNSMITLDDISLYASQEYQEDIERYWLKNHVQQYPENALDLYRKIPESSKNLFITDSLQMLLKSQPEIAIGLVFEMDEGANYDFQSRTGEVFLQIYHLDIDASTIFLKYLNIWDLSYFSDAGKSLLKSLKKLSTRKLVTLYENLVLFSDEPNKEELATLLLCAIVVRKPQKAFEYLSELLRVIPKEAIEEIIPVLFSELLQKRPELSKKFLPELYSYVQNREFSIPEEVLYILEHNISICILKMNTHLLEVSIHRWAFVPEILAKISYQLLRKNPQRAILAIRYLAGRIEFFYVFGGSPVEIFLEKWDIFELHIVAKENTVSIQDSSIKNELVELAKTTLLRLSNKDLQKAIPYLCLPIWTDEQRWELRKTINLKAVFSIENQLILATLDESTEFIHSRFDLSLKSIALQLQKSNWDIVETERRLLTLALQLFLYLELKTFDDVVSVYWSHLERLVPTLVHSISDCEKQMKWCRKIPSVDDKLDALDKIATTYVSKEKQDCEEFLENATNIIYECGGLEPHLERIPNIIILYMEHFPQKISKLLRRHEGEIPEELLENILEFLSDHNKFSVEKLEYFWPWISQVTNCNTISDHDLLYFFCQILERLIEVDDQDHIQKVAEKTLSFADHCQEQEKKYYFEDLIPFLIPKDIALACRIVNSYEDHEERFIDIAVAWAKSNFQKAIKFVEDHHNKDVACNAMLELIRNFAKYEDARIERLLKSKLLEGKKDVTNQNMAIAKAYRGVDTQYLEKISDRSVKLQTYCEVARIYQEKGRIEYLQSFRREIRDIIEELFQQPENEDFVEFSYSTLENLSLVDPEIAIDICKIYASFQEEKDYEDMVNAIFPGIAKFLPEQASQILKEIQGIDLSNHISTLNREVLRSPQRAIEWIVICQQPELIPDILDSVKNTKILRDCICKILESTDLGKPSYLSTIAILIPYIYQFEGDQVVFDLFLQIKHLSSLNISDEDFITKLQKLCVNVG